MKSYSQREKTEGRNLKYFILSTGSDESDPRRYRHHFSMEKKDSKNKLENEFEKSEKKNQSLKIPRFEVKMEKKAHKKTVNRIIIGSNIEQNQKHRNENLFFFIEK